MIGWLFQLLLGGAGGHLIRAGILAAGASLIGAGGLHLARGWLDSKVDRGVAIERLTRAQQDFEARYTALAEQHQRELSAAAAENERLDQAVEKMQSEVSWARGHVEKQGRRIRQLTDAATGELRECLDLAIDPDYIR